FLSHVPFFLVSFFSHSLSIPLVLAIIRPPPTPTLFPYTTLFRSGCNKIHQRCATNPEYDFHVTKNYDACTFNGHWKYLYVIILRDRKSTRLNSSHVSISYAVFCLKKKKKTNHRHDSITRAIRHDI